MAGLESVVLLLFVILALCDLCSDDSRRTVELQGRAGGVVRALVF